MQEKKNSKQKIVVIGDVWVDNVLVPTPWQKGNKLAAFNLPGGALLIRDMMKAFPHKTNNFEIISYPEKDREKWSNQDIIISIAEGEKFIDKKVPGETYYIKKSLGYSDPGPGNGVPAFARDFTYESSKEKEFIIIDEAGNGFRNVESAWKNIFEDAEKNKNAVIIYNMSGPLFTGKLWEAISQKNLLNRVILIIDANDLREEGLNLSRKLSWDRTIADFVTILAYKKHNQIEKCPHILVRFGLEGVIYYHQCAEKEGKRGVQVF